MLVRPYNEATDLAHVKRIWREVGWAEDEDDEKMIPFFYEGANLLIGEVKGEAECATSSAPGVVRYQRQDLSFLAITAVVTSHVARRMGLATRMTAQLLAEGAQAGAEVAALGIFEQGFYDKVGFGTMPYIHWLSFDPGQLQVPSNTRRPIRLSMEKDWGRIQDAILKRKRLHGACNIHLPHYFKADLLWHKKAFGLGFEDESGTLTHLVILEKRKGEHGPFTVKYFLFEERHQMLELFGLLKELGDQVYTYIMREPPNIQLLDLLAKPSRMNRISEKSQFAIQYVTHGYQQVRILALEPCIGATKVPGPALSFNLALNDPAAKYLPANSAWKGLGGSYTVSLGPASSIAPQFTEGLPQLQASVGAFTRLWFGCRNASALAITDELEGNQTLLTDLDEVLASLPSPDFNLEF